MSGKSCVGKECEFSTKQEMLSLTYVITGLSFCRAQLRVQLQCSVSNAMFERDVVLTKGNQMITSLNGS